MKLKILATIIVISVGSTMSIAQTKKKATHKSDDESKTEMKSRQDAKHPNARGNKEGNPTSSEEQTATAGNGLAPNEHGKVKGTGEGSGPGSDAGVGLNSGVGGSTASSSGSGAVPTEGTDGTNTKPRATRNMAGSPMPANAGVTQQKKTDDEKVGDSKSRSSSEKAVEQKNVKDKKKRRG